eukprot:2522207-Prorocentrum_lima.AAC.1
MRHNATGRIWIQPAFGEVVAGAHPGQTKALEQRGQVGHVLCSQSWTNKVTYVVATVTAKEGH